jgi:DNA-binding GntR family transcriptional regulator
VQSPVHRRVELTSVFDDLARSGEDREAISFRRLQCASGEPLAEMMNYLPVEIAPEPGELEYGGLYRTLRARGVHIRLARRRLGARPTCCPDLPAGISLLTPA